jgi:hypothetical protein
LAASFYLENAVDTKNSSNWKLNNISVRAKYSSEAIRIIKKHPLFGVGIGDKKFILIERNIELGDNRYVEFGKVQNRITSLIPTINSLIFGLTQEFFPL